MATEISKNLGEIEYDNLIIGSIPITQVGGGTIRKLEAATTLIRGTLLAKSSADGKLVVLGSEAVEGETLTPDSILCDDIEVGTSEDVPVVVYTAGCFNSNKVIVKKGYTITSSDIDALRKYDIILKSAATI